jgi:hypothetical protein
VPDSYLIETFDVFLLLIQNNRNYNCNISPRHNNCNISPRQIITDYIYYLVNFNKELDNANLMTVVEHNFTIVIMWRGEIYNCNCLEFCGRHKYTFSIIGIIFQTNRLPIFVF